MTVPFESCDFDAGTGHKTSLGLNQYEVIKRIFEETDELRKSTISETHREQQNKLSESIIIISEEIQIDVLLMNRCI